MNKVKEFWVEQKKQSSLKNAMVLFLFGVFGVFLGVVGSQLLLQPEPVMSDAQFAELTDVVISNPEFIEEG